MLAAAILLCIDRGAAVLPSRRAVMIGGAAATGATQLAGAAGALGVVQGLLDPCPETASCVSSQDDAARGGKSFSEPWSYDETDWRAAARRLARALEVEPGVRDVEASDRYTRCVAVSGDKVDDVEFFFTEGDFTVQFRAARRGGGGDLGANAARLERLRKKCGFEKLVVLRNRRRAFGLIETPLDSFGPSFFDQGDAALLDPDVLRTKDLDPLAPPAFPAPSDDTRRWLREKRRDGG